jgi:sulfur carrier protein
MPRVTVCWSPAPRQVLERELDLPEGACVRDALAASGFAQGDAPDDFAQAETGIWGRRCSPDQLVREGDRIEAWRPLRVDPKVARRERFRAQGARAAGLFAKRRPGAKPGY